MRPSPLLRGFTALARAVLFALVAVVALPGRATADAARPAATIALRSPSGPTRPLELVPGDGGWVGDFDIANEGKSALIVSRIAVRGDDVAPRVPPRLTVRFTEGTPTSAVLQPGASRRVHVAWMPDKAPRQRQVWGHVIVTSSDERAGEVAMGVHVQLPAGVPWLERHGLSALLVLPLLGVLAVLFGAATGCGGRRFLSAVPIAATGLQCLVALWLYAHFDARVAPGDGNDGFQFIERAAWVRALAVEYFVGVDGASIGLVLLTPLVALAGAIAGATVEKAPAAYHALYLVLIAGLTGVFCALDLFLLFFFWQMAAAPAAFLIAGWGGAGKERAALETFVSTMAGALLVLVGFIALYAFSDRSFLVDGTAVEHSWALPELSRVAFAGKGGTLFAVPLMKWVWVLLFAGFALEVPMFPLHTWLSSALSEAPTPVSVVIAGVFLKTGLYGLLRVNVALLPEATRWASGALVAFGVVNVVYGALCAMAQTDLKRLLAYGTLSQMGFALMGIGALTPQGVAGSLLGAFAHGLTVTVLFLLVGVLEARAQGRDVGRFGGLAGEMPLYSALMAGALLASMGAPGFAGFWGEALPIAGAFPTFRWLAATATIGMALGAAYHLRVFARVFLGAVPERWRTSAALEPFGGRFPDIGFRELASLAPAAVLLILLGLWPAPILRIVSGGVRMVTGVVNGGGIDAPGVP